MTPLDALISLAIFVFVIVPLAVAVCALSRIRNANESDRLGEALAVWDFLEAQPEFNEGMERARLGFDPAKTAGGSVGKRWDTYCRQTDGRGETYTGGCGDQLYFVPNPAIDDEYDHHTLDALYGDDDTITETL